jgi:hypothetical protein
MVVLGAKDVPLFFTTSFFLGVTRYVPVRCYGHKISITVIQSIQIFKMKYSKYSIKK